MCKCPAWLQHVPLVGKHDAEPAGAYPEELTDAVAQKVISAWKRILNLEWWRFEVAKKSNQVNSLQAKWLANEEKKRKRKYEDAKPLQTNPLSKALNEDAGTSKALEAKSQEGEELPSSSEGPS